MSLFTLSNKPPHPQKSLSRPETPSRSDGSVDSRPLENHANQKIFEHVDFTEEQLSCVENIIDWERIYVLISGHYYFRAPFKNEFHALVKKHICERLQGNIRPLCSSKYDGKAISEPRRTPQLEPFALDLERFLSEPNIKEKINQEVVDQLSAWIPFLKMDETLEKAFARSGPLSNAEEITDTIKSVFFDKDTSLNSEPSYLAYLRFVWSGFWLDSLRLGRRNLHKTKLISLRIKLRFLFLDDWIAQHQRPKIFAALQCFVRKVRGFLTKVKSFQTSGFLRLNNSCSPSANLNKRNKSLRKYNRLLSALRFVECPDFIGPRFKAGNLKIGQKLIEIADDLEKIHAHKEALACLRLGTIWAGNRNKMLMRIGHAAYFGRTFYVAEAAYRTAIMDGDKNPWVWKSLGLTLLATGREQEADRILRFCVRKNPAFGMPHQNLAARYNLESYVPQPLDLSGCPGALLYDGYQLTGEYHIHVGEGERAMHFFGEALKCQKRIAKEFVIPSEIRWMLEENYGVKKEESIRILPYEWVTQIGHIAMLDTYRKLQLIGQAKRHRNLLLAPKDKVSNHAYLELWKEHFTLIEQEDHIQMVFPYQRIIGDCFNAYLNDAGQARCWTELGAEAHIRWDQGRKGSIVAIPDAVREGGKNILKDWGIKEDSWFVALHVRDLGFHSEKSGSMQSHRNASISDYLGAIHEITSRGGWVIRMGDPSMPKMPKMPRTIDYAHSPQRVEWMDVFLMSEARFFLGTTSGLANAVISLGTPCLLVNCISNYFQLWNKNVKFTLKSLWNEKENQQVLLSEMLKNTFRWELFNIHALARRGIYPRGNEHGEITAAVLEMLNEPNASKDSSPSTADIALKKACSDAGNENFFGNGTISKTFYDTNREWIR